MPDWKGCERMELVLSNICKSFGEKKVLDSFSHRFEGGKTCCILGPSGCGKTTLLRIICGLLAADSGEIQGNDANFSMVFQEDRLFENLSAEKNVLLTARKGFGREDARRLLAELGIAESGKRVCEYSGGMKRRVAVARALAADYDVLLLDEPMSGLDGENRRKCLEVIQKMTAGKTVICVTHEPRDAELLGGSSLYF